MNGGRKRSGWQERSSALAPSLNCFLDKEGVGNFDIPNGGRRGVPSCRQLISRGASQTCMIQLSAYCDVCLGRRGGFALVNYSLIVDVMAPTKRVAFSSFSITRVDGRAKCTKKTEKVAPHTAPIHQRRHPSWYDTRIATKHLLRLYASFLWPRGALVAIVVGF